MHPLNLSFAACGFLGIYHLGAATAFLKHGQNMLKTVKAFAGASSGSLVATLLLTAPDKTKECQTFTYKFAEEVRNQTFGAATPGYDFINSLRAGIESILPSNAHEVAENRLFVSITNIRTRENYLVSNFASREDLIKVLLASSFVPVYAGIKAVEYKGEISLANLERLNHALFPPKREKMESLFQNGFNDTVLFLLKENWFEQNSEKQL
ncbi:patatin-like phospholipase domain-containing protein 4 isoform X2 [Microcaecilia unicolor]|uniref:Patatin-like phospholipase domain-containing protein 4 isoform X2 n=1 Tax=Microcaecilia unicolor TaxID=1415580 RepID=A0A6P7XQ53_9AMPH|nr:patatin-like phospholipase domain-containing protein 4 isoform X2 [Microcaecilia unicolor]